MNPTTVYGDVLHLLDLRVFGRDGARTNGEGTRQEVVRGGFSKSIILIRSGLESDATVAHLRYDDSLKSAHA